MSLRKIEFSFMVSFDIFCFENMLCLCKCDLIVKIRCFSLLNLSFLTLLMVYVLLIILVVCQRGVKSVKEIKGFHFR